MLPLWLKHHTEMGSAWLWCGQGGSIQSKHSDWGETLKAEELEGRVPQDLYSQPPGHIEAKKPTKRKTEKSILSQLTSATTKSETGKFGTSLNCLNFSFQVMEKKN